MRHTKTTIAATLILLALTMPACQAIPAPSATSPAKAPATVAAPTSAASPAATPQTSTSPSYGGILTRAMPRDVTSFDVQRESGADVSLSLFNVYQGLVRLDPIGHQKVLPELADKWEVSADGKTYTFHLNSGVKWHDGKPMTMDDVQYSIERMHNPKAYNTVSPRGEGLLKALDTVAVVDSSTIKLTTKYPSASFLPNIATGWVAIEPKAIIEAKGDMRRDLVGTGPFKLKQFNPGIGLDLQKNADYYVKGSPYLDGISFYTIKDDATRFAAFRSGKVKMTFVGIYGLSPASVQVLKQEMSDKVTIYEHDAQTRQAIVFNTQKKPWDDVRVRKAVDLAFDRQAAAKVNGRGYVGGIYDAPWGTKPEDITKLPGFRQPKDADVAEAKKLLADAGYPNGFKTTLLSPTGGFAEGQVVVAKDQLAKIGIEAEVSVVEYATLWDRAGRKAFDLISATRTDNTNDPDEVLYTYYYTNGSGNWQGFSDKSLDELIDKQAGTLDAKAREAILADIEKKILDQVPMVVAFWDVFQTGAWKDVKNFSPGPGIHPWGKLDQVWLAK